MVRVSPQYCRVAAKSPSKGQLRIGDDWNAIRVVTLSQSNPLKAVAELVENSIDAHARTVTREHGEHYLSIRDDGDGIPRDGESDSFFAQTAGASS